MKPKKPKPMEYQIMKENGSASTFLMAFIKALIISRFFLHEKVLVIDNAPIHTSGDDVVVKQTHHIWGSCSIGVPSLSKQSSAPPLMVAVEVCTILTLCQMNL
jgi:hypothetical protein